jgi:hypothetical protein
MNGRYAGILVVVFAAFVTLILWRDGQLPLMYQILPGIILGLIGVAVHVYPRWRVRSRVRRNNF